MLDINLKQLEVFVAAAEYNSFTKAAEALYLSQSTVSSHIRSLEEALGTVLFRRDAKKKIELTEAGKRAYGPSRDILERCRNLQSTLAEQEAPLLTVGASTVPAQYLLPELLAGFSRQRPDCRFLLKRRDSVQIHEALRIGEVQVGFVGMRLDEKEFEYHPVLQDRLVLVTANAERFQELPMDAGLELLQREPVVAREEASGTWRETAEWLQKRNIPPESLHILARMENPESIRRAVAQGMGVSVLSSLAVQEDVSAGRLLQFELSREGAWRQICLVLHRETERTPLLTDFLQFAIQ